MCTHAKNTNNDYNIRISKVSEAKVSRIICLPCSMLVRKYLLEPLTDAEVEAVAFAGN